MLSFTLTTVLLTSFGPKVPRPIGSAKRPSPRKPRSSESRCTAQPAKVALGRSSSKAAVTGYPRVCSVSLVVSGEDDRPLLISRRVDAAREPEAVAHLGATYGVARDLTVSAAATWDDLGHHLTASALATAVGEPVRLEVSQDALRSRAVSLVSMRSPGMGRQG